jgi:large subunit ribosomal protein L23
MTTAYDIIRRPIITEQSMSQTEGKKYTFEVARDAKRSRSPERSRRYSGQVAKVNTLNMQGKEKRTAATLPAAAPAGRRQWSH